MRLLLLSLILTESLILLTLFQTVQILVNNYLQRRPSYMTNKNDIYIYDFHSKNRYTTLPGHFPFFSFIAYQLFKKIL